VPLVGCLVRLLELLGLHTTLAFRTFDNGQIQD
jgi:hypothetical protein